MIHYSTVDAGYVVIEDVLDQLVSSDTEFCKNFFRVSTKVEHELKMLVELAGRKTNRLCDLNQH